MKRIILTYTLAFSLLSAYAGEGGSPPLKNTDKSKGGKTKRVNMWSV